MGFAPCSGQGRVEVVVDSLKSVLFVKTVVLPGQFALILPNRFVYALTKVHFIRYAEYVRIRRMTS